MEGFSNSRTLRWTLFGVVFFILYNGATFFYRDRLTTRDILGTPCDASFTRQIFQIRFQWNTDLSSYQFERGELAEESSPCKTALYYLESIHGGDKREVLIIAYLVELAYYRPDRIDIQRMEIKKPRMKVTLEDLEDGIVRTAIFPYAVFNTRKYPKGEYLRVYGIDTSYCRDTIIGEWEVKIIEGEFNEIGFEVVPNTGFMKNIPEAIGFNGRKHGSLILLKDKQDRKLMMIHYADSPSDEEYGQYLESLLSKLPALSIKKF